MPKQTGTAGTIETENEHSAAVVWNDQAMTTHFANVINVQSTREQLELFFGLNRTWNIGQGGGMTVDLSNRIVLTPHAAKRLVTILAGVLREYEMRHGTLEVEK